MIKEGRINFLKEKLNLFLNSNLKTFDNLKDLTSNGVYAVYKGQKLIYIGKTTRRGKDRIREMVSDFRSHTLNRKLLRKHLNEKFKLNLDKLPNKSKKELIEKKILTKEQFKQAQREVNTYVKTKFKFKFILLTLKEINSFEHFAIGVLNPKYND